ncbi:hypothetical protein ABZS71_12190 [Streptomyces sp. NPDC005393]|uniref:hypothetical protein n=1 Tax=Streptomyces sp. NPDC005393 TaxID=3157041 RepID=UPI0033B833D3
MATYVRRGTHSGRPRPGRTGLLGAAALLLSAPADAGTFHYALIADGTAARRELAQWAAAADF